MKAKIGELFLVLGIGLFIAGAIGFMAGYLSQDQTVMFLVAPLASASDWQMVRHDSRNTGYTNETVPDELELLWRGYDPKGWLDRFLRMVMSTDPLVADEKVFGVFNSELHAIDADTGKKIWSYEIGKYPTSIATPIAIASGKVFFGSEDSKIYALDEDTGKLTWSYDLMHEPRSIAVAPGKVFVGAGAGGEKIYCFGAAKGEKGVPGFEVIFASAGLLIGAYLLRRRVKNGK